MYQLLFWINFWEYPGNLKITVTPPWPRFESYHGIFFPYTGVQSINNVFHIVDKVENVCVNKYIFDLIDNVEYVDYALYSSILFLFILSNSHPQLRCRAPYKILAPLNFFLRNYSIFSVFENRLKISLAKSYQFEMLKYCLTVCCSKLKSEDLI